MVEMLKQGKIAALILDANFVLHIAGTQCDFAYVGLPFLVGDVGVNFRGNVPRPLIDEFNR